MNITVYLADQNPQRDRTQGVTTYTRAVLSGLAKIPDLSIHTIVSRSSYAFAAPGVTQTTLPWITSNQLLRLLTDQGHALFRGNHQADVWYYPKGYLPFFLPARRRVVGTVHDTILQYYADNHPDYRSRLDYAYWLGMMRRSIKRFDHVITDSFNSKRQIENLCARYNIRTPPITVAYAAVEMPRGISGSFPKQDYICHFASSAPHKNTEKVVNLWLDLTARKSDTPKWLYLLGRDAELFKKYESSSRVRCVGFTPNDKMREMLSAARAVVMGSSIEGFGLPVLEAYLMGTPACFVRGTACEEVVAAFTRKGAFDLNDSESFQHALGEALNMSNEEMKAIQQGIADFYSIDRVSGAVAAVMKEVNK
jgi:glycosyltransferase involved in cell wall biosynthesis